MELRLPHMLHLFNVFRENDGKENCAQVLEEEVNKMFGIKSLNDEHDCNVVSMNSMNIHDVYDMQSHKLGDAVFDENDMFENLFAAINVCPKLGDAMFNEDDIFSPPSFDVQIYYDDSMPPIYDNYIDESGFGRVSNLGSSDPTILEGVESYYNDKSGFGEVMTLFSNDSTILEEVSIDYDENKVATYDDYCDDTYVIKSSDDYIYKTCHNYEYPFSEHYSFNVETIYSNRVSYDTPTIPNEKSFAHVESSKISMLVDHQKNALCDSFIVEFIHDATENYYERGTYAYRCLNNIKFSLYALKVLKLHFFCLPMLVDSCSHKLFSHKIPMHRKWVRLKCV
jgi:hypothetical protein